MVESITGESISDRHGIVALQLYNSNSDIIVKKKTKTKNVTKEKTQRLNLPNQFCGFFSV